MTTATATEPTALDLAATAIHEAAHAASIVLRGGRITACRALDKPRDGIYGYTQFTGLADVHAEFTSYAGPWAEARFRAGGTPTHADLLASLDRNGGDHGDLVERGRYGLPRHHEHEYATLWSTICDLAATMIGRDGLRLTDVDVRKALGINRDGSNRATVASMVASGLAPGGYVKAPGELYDPTR